MKEFNPEAVRIERASAVGTVLEAQAERQYPAYIAPTGEICGLVNDSTGSESIHQTWS